ncbi:MAG TPA: dihydropteroate synthase [Acidobacteriaceae bacterium]|jgi:dihydropteroate synthase|nr:dihydropteroate synthase [Acidobacteriaceae bacterium]
MTFTRRPAFTWQLRTRSLALGPRTRVMGIVNVTPDSFSESGAHHETLTAIEHGLTLLDQGADLLDIGGESTRPGATPVSVQEEQDRILPVIVSILHRRPGTLLSIDTYHAETARAAIAAGAEIVNDVSGFLWDPALASVCAELQCGVILMHTRGRPSEWRTLPPLPPQEVLPLVRSGLVAALDGAIAAGIDRSRIVLDPGYGFGKAYDANYPLLAHQDELLSLGQPLLAGVSRKSFLAHALAESLPAEPAMSPPVADASASTAKSPAALIPPAARGNATLAAVTTAILAGASMVRVHDVRPTVEATRIADAIVNAL